MDATNKYVRIAQFLSQGRSLVWARIIYREGSAPRSVGADFILLDDDTLVGSIGGGGLEYEILETAKAMRNQSTPRVVRFDMKGEDVEASDMICGGTVEVLIEPLSAKDSDTVQIFSTIKTFVLNGMPGTFVTHVGGGLDEKKTGRRMLVAADGMTYGDTLAFSFSLAGHVSASSTLIRCPDSGHVYFVEPLVSTPELLLFGAGHISTCLAPIAKMVGFRVVVVDDRSEYANRERFPGADDIFVMPFEKALRQLPTSGQSHIVIVTRGHRYDKLVLEAVLKKPHAYIGMIGSLRKRDTVYGLLTQAGVSPQTLAGVYSPIGLDIGAETPEEIAVSIISELIDFRAEKRKAMQVPAQKGQRSTG